MMGTCSEILSAALRCLGDDCGGRECDGNGEGDSEQAHHLTISPDVTAKLISQGRAPQSDLAVGFVVTGRNPSNGAPVDPLLSIGVGNQCRDEAPKQKPREAN